MKFLHQHFDKATGALTREQVLDHPFPVLNPDVETVKVTVMTKTNEWVCAWCDVDNRVPCEMRDENGVVFQTYTICAYCGRTELRFGKLGRQTQIPPAKTPPEGFPF